MNLKQLSTQLRKEQQRLKKQLASIDSALAALNGAGVRRKQYKLSAATRRKQSIAQRKRWAAVRKAKGEK
jgi:hypothetical protein